MIIQTTFSLIPRPRGCHLVTREVLEHLTKPYYEHTMEGADDMPTHAMCSLFEVSLTIPITAGRLNLGTRQEISLCEFRNYGGPRKIVAIICE